MFNAFARKAGGWRRRLRRPGCRFARPTSGWRGIASPATQQESSKRGTGWEALHVAVDDASRLAYTELLPNERKHHAIAFLEHALAFFAAHGVAVERVMTDNGSAYKSYDFAPKDCGIYGLNFANIPWSSVLRLPEPVSFNLNSNICFNWANASLETEVFGL